EAGADVNKGNGTNIPLNYVNHNEELLLLLLHKGANVLKTTRNQRVQDSVPYDLYNYAFQLNRILRQNSKLPNPLNAEKIDGVTGLMAKNPEHAEIFNFIDPPKN